MTTGPKLSYSIVVKSHLPPKDARRQPVAAASGWPEDTWEQDNLLPAMHADPEPVDWALDAQDYSGWYAEPPGADDDWRYGGWYDGSTEFVLHWQQGVYDALHGREPEKLSEFFDALAWGLLPSKRQEWCGQQEPGRIEEQARSETQRSDTMREDGSQDAGAEAEAEGAAAGEWGRVEADVAAWQVRDLSSDNAADAWAPSQMQHGSDQKIIADLWYETQHDALRADEERKDDGEGWHQVTSKRKPKPRRDARGPQASRQKAARRRYR